LDLDGTEYKDNKKEQRRSYRLNKL
jgi:hypothetical protein